MEHISDNLNVDYACFDDMPKLVKDIAHFSISGEVPAAQVAFMLKCKVEYVHKVLNYPVVSEYISRVRDQRLFEQLEKVEKLSNTGTMAIEQLQKQVMEGELSARDLMKVIELVGDRVTGSGLIKQTKQIHESGKDGVRKEVLAQLKAAGSANIIEYKPKQAEVVPIAEEG